MGLFRTEVVEARRRRLWGEVRLSQPPSLIAWCVVTIVVIALAGGVLATASFPKKQTVAGFIAPEAGLISVRLTNSGTIAGVLVEEGAVVTEGQPLLQLTGDAGTARLSSVLVDQIEEYKNQLSSVEIRRRSVDANIDSQRLVLEARVASAKANLAQLLDGRVLQAEAVSLAKSETERFDDLVKRGFAPKAEYERRRRSELAERATLNAIDREIDATRGVVAESGAELLQLPAVRAQQLSSLDSERSVLQQRLVEAELAKAQVIRAPTGGIVADIAVSKGQPAVPGAIVLTIVPQAGPLEAQLLVPTRAIGEMKVGQSARLQIEAFPYRSYGFLEGSIRGISRTALSPGEDGLPIQVKEPVYRVRVRLDRNFLQRGNRRRFVQPGMILTADVVTSRPKLWEQIFGPIMDIRLRNS